MTKQNKTTITKKTEQKGKRKEEKRKNSFPPKANSGPSTCGPFHYHYTTCSVMSHIRCRQGGHKAIYRFINN